MSNHTNRELNAATPPSAQQPQLTYTIDQLNLLIATCEQRGWQEAIAVAAQHSPTTKMDETECWLACSCGWQSGPGRGWTEMWQQHIRSLRPSPAQGAATGKSPSASPDSHVSSATTKEHSDA